MERAQRAGRRAVAIGTGIAGDSSCRRESRWAVSRRQDEAAPDPSWIPEGCDWGALRTVAAHFARVHGASRDDAEDIAQEALLNLHRRRDRVREPIDWLFIVTRRLTARTRAAGSTSFSARTAASRQSINQSINQSMTAPAVSSEGLLRRLAQASGLTMRQRRLLILVAQGFTHQEIALRLGSSRSAIGHQVARAVHRLERGASRPASLVRPPSRGAQGSGYPRTAAARHRQQSR